MALKNHPSGSEVGKNDAGLIDLGMIKTTGCIMSSLEQL